MSAHSTILNDFRCFDLCWSIQASSCQSLCFTISSFHLHWCNWSALTTVKLASTSLQRQKTYTSHMHDLFLIFSGQICVYLKIQLFLWHWSVSLAHITFFFSCVKSIIIDKNNWRGITDYDDDDINFSSQNSELMTKHVIIGLQILL